MKIGTINTKCSFKGLWGKTEISENGVVKRKYYPFADDDKIKIADEISKYPNDTVIINKALNGITEELYNNSTTIRVVINNLLAE